MSEKNRLIIEYDIVCGNCFKPIDFMIHDSLTPTQIAVSFCPECVESKIKSGIESERRMMRQMLDEYFKNTNKS